MALFKAKFGEVQLLKDFTLGIGSYGVVFKARCDNLICAAKVLHPTLFNPSMQHRIASERASVTPIRKFEQECEFLSTIRHPNVVQYLGLCEDRETGLPVLLMELMDGNLTRFLHHDEDLRGEPLPYHVQVNICHDITLALSFLHSNNIIHRDLSSNNVLLISDIRAKVTDFGMATLGTEFASRLSLTKAPGSDAYMPPEAVWNTKPSYTKTLDCFSFGVVVIQVLTRLPPEPGDRLKQVSHDMDVRVSEIERRQEHISKVDPGHPLLPIALDCLKDRGSDRPSAKQLCERLAALKGEPKYNDDILEAKDKVRDQLREQVQDLQQKVESLQFQKDHDLRQQLDHALEEIREKDRIIKEVNTQLGHANQQLATLEQARSQFQRQFQEYDQQTRQLLKGQPIKLSWSEGKKAPIKVFRWSNAVTNGDTIYVKFAGSKIILQYNTWTNWTQLPDCPVGLCSIAVVNGSVTTIGGSEGNDYTNKLFSLIKVLHGRKESLSWITNLPPMPTRRNQATSLCTETALIVAGGNGEDGVILKKVEVMNIETLQWSRAKDLLEPQVNASMTVCGSYIYMLGGINDEGATCKIAFSVPLSSLLKWHSDEGWKRIADLPYISATAVSICDRLLAIGGRESNDVNSPCVRTIQMYNLTTDSWEGIGYVSVGRSRCFATVLPGNQLFVVGGWTGCGLSTDNQTDRVEIGTLL